MSGGAGGFSGAPPAKVSESVAVSPRVMVLRSKTALNVAERETNGARHKQAAPKAATRGTVSRRSLSRSDVRRENKMSITTFAYVCPAGIGCASLHRFARLRASLTIPFNGRYMDNSAGVLFARNAADSGCAVRQIILVSSPKYEFDWRALPEPFVLLNAHGSERC